MFLLATNLTNLLETNLDEPTNLHESIADESTRIHESNESVADESTRIHESNESYSNESSRIHESNESFSDESNRIETANLLGSWTTLSSNKKVDASFVTPESIQRMLKDMNLPYKMDHHTTKFYQQVCVLYVHKVFDLAMEYSNQRQSTNVEMKDVLRAIKKYSVLPPNQWNQIRLKGTHPLRRKMGRNSVATTHKRRLNIARKSLRSMDKSSHKNKK